MTDTFESPVAAKFTYRGEDVFTYAIETFDEVIDDIRPLLASHWDELAAYSDIPLDPDFEFYRRANVADVLRIYTARKNGGLIGYILMTVLKSHPHYSAQPWSVSDIVLVVKEHRTFGVGSALFDFLERDLEGFVVQIHTKASHPELGVLLLSRGYAPIEITYSKRL